MRQTPYLKTMKDIPNEQKIISWEWSSNLEIKNIFCPSRGPEFGPQLSHGGLQSFITSDLSIRESGTFF